MNKHIYSLVLSGLLGLVSNLVYAQDSPQACKVEEMMLQYLETHPEAQAEFEATELFISNWIENAEKNNTVQTASTYTIPVVYHIYGATQGGQPVNLSVVQNANDNWVNKDFNGLNSDFGTVHTQWLSKRGTLSITFALAKKDPNGNPTNGIVSHPVTAGYGNGSGYDAQIAADAWDNYKYMNIYVMHDLYNDGVTNNSGVAWYPSTAMSNAKTARVVYNGLYLGPNSWSSEFASTHSHEFGHWLNLQHTFQGGCASATNDNVADTPPTNGSQGCHSTSTSNAPLNCTSILVNAENYMDYNTDCYKMFTQGQITRMDAALQLPSRVTLWQTSNLIATGLLNSTGISEPATAASTAVYPNPSTGDFNFSIAAYKKDDYKIEISGVLGNIISTHNTGIISGEHVWKFDIPGQPAGVYFVSVFDSAGHLVSVNKLVKQ